jgi:hypothetical protein
MPYKNPLDKKNHNKKYYLKNKKYLNKKTLLKYNIKYNSDHNFRLLRLLRSRVLDALKGKSKSKKTKELIGISIEGLVKYLENKFKPGMNWKKKGLIHIDHIIPCSSFDLSDPKQQAKCFHYTNLQPLWAHENLSKGAKIIKSNS